MVGVLAQLTGDELGVLRFFIGALSTAFLGVVGWVGIYMRRQAERVEQHVTDLAVMKTELTRVKDDLEDLERRVLDVERRRP